MIKEVELKKLNGATQYVDWETGQELFKKSDCIPLSVIRERVEELEKELRKKMPSAEFDSKFIAVEFYSRLLKGIV